MNPYLYAGIGIISTSIIINPLTVSLYTLNLGWNMGLSNPDDTYGYIYNVYNLTTKKYLGREAYKFGFVRDMSMAGALHKWLLFGPLATPYSAYFALRATINYIVYNLRYKSIVETGKFDDNETLDDIIDKIRKSTNIPLPKGMNNPLTAYSN
jgi:hypothetical protein